MTAPLTSSPEDAYHRELDYTAGRRAAADDDIEKGEPGPSSSSSSSPSSSSLVSPPLPPSATQEQLTSLQESPQAPKRRRTLPSSLSLKSRLLMVVVFVGIVATMTTYFVLRLKEASLFRRQFSEFADTILHGFHEDVCKREQFASLLSTSLSKMNDIHDFTNNDTSVRTVEGTNKKSSSMDWESIVLNILNKSVKPGVVVAYSPILKTREDYQVWEAYADAAAADAADNMALSVDETITPNGESLNVYASNVYKLAQPQQQSEPIDNYSNFNQRVHDNSNSDSNNHQDTEYIVPSWYVYPAPEECGTESHLPSDSNNNTASTSIRTSTSCYKSNQMKEEERKEPLEQLIHRSPYNSTNKNDMEYYYSRILHDVTPRSILYHPVFKTTSLTFEDIPNATTRKQNAPSIPVAGVVSIQFDWDTVFALNPFPVMIDGIHLILENSVGQNYTFRFDKGKVVLVGEGDFHKDFEDMKIESSYLSFHSSCFRESAGDNINFEDENDKIKYRILLYPMAKLKTNYTSKDPVWFAIAAALLCVINATLFLFYDYIVQRRQQQNMKTAEQTNAVVNSLFPASFRDRLHLLHQPTGNQQDPVEGSGTTTNCNNTTTATTASKAEKGGNGFFQLLQPSPHAEAVEESTVANNETTQSQARTRGISFREIMKQSSVTDMHQRSSIASCSSKKCIKSKLPEPPKAKLKSFLYETGVSNAGGEMEKKNVDNGISNKLTLNNNATQPIADFFPHTTVMFADISGFTAWSSEREPVDVFCLLETLFLEFDALLSFFKVFKVETIGDCYVAVTGLPEPSKDHAVRLSRFASECILVMHNACQKLESTLGPGTGDLTLRVGLHSGSVTAGVLRGQKLRFQLFGDTVNTAARMESHSRDNMIQCSQATADLLTKAGKGNWVTPRDDRIEVKGKGPLQTYWCRPTRKLPPIGDHRSSLLLRTSSMRSFASIESSSHNSSSALGQNSSQCSDLGRAKDWGNTSVDYFIPRRIPREEKRRCRETQLVNWNIKILATSLEKVVARRQALEQIQGSPSGGNRKPHSLPAPRQCNGTDEKKCHYQELPDKDDADRVDEDDKVGEIAPFKEVTEIIELCCFDRKIANHHTSFSNYQSGTNGLLSETVLNQLRSFVSRIAKMYKDVPFHNLEHASHVTMSASKLMNRIVTPEGVDYYQNDEDDDEDEEEDEALKEYELKLAENIHYSTFGISSDPLAQFAIIFSALVHDVEHTGLTNAQLVHKKAGIAIKYDGVSVAEQNSVAIAWNLLMEPYFSDLRQTMFATPHECSRFRRLVVNTVMATDIIDKELQSLRKNRWKKAFHETSNLQKYDHASKESDTILNRKATIVIEHIIQASDVAHTMQHWHIYTRWNEKFFMECYRAYLNGIEAVDPSIKWYENEMGFFDHYIIPLAYKLKECGVFGVSCDEYLGFALENRLEWEVKGVQIVEDMLNRAKNLCMVHDENGNESG